MTSILPSSWRWITLDAIAARVPNAIVDGPFGSNLKLDDYVDDGVPVLQGKNITNDRFKWFDVRFISDRKATELKRSSVRVGDILIVKIGSIGYSAILDDLQGFEYAIIPANLAKVTTDSNVVDLSYLHRWLTSTEAKRYFARVASKTAQPALSLGKIRSLPVPLPPLPDQRRIAAILDKADALRAKRRAAIAQLDTLTQSIFLDMFGDPIENPRKFPVRHMLDLVDEHRPISYGILMPGPDQPEGVKYVRVVDMRDGGIELSGIRKTTFAISNSFHRSLLKSGDLLMSIRGHVGRFAVVPSGLDRANITQDTARLAIVGADPVFVRECLRTAAFQRWMAKHTKGVAVRGINLGDVKLMPVIVPRLSEQREFARRAAGTDDLRVSYRSSLAELNTLFASLQYRAFRGEL
jgi:type I restriction enzyme S subunit